VLPCLFLLLLTMALIGGALWRPEFADGLAYRTPRVLHWLHQHGWEWIQTMDQRKNNRGVGFEWITAPLLRAYLNRPSIDMATGVFSHADRWAGTARQAFAELEHIECVGLLHTRQNIAINGATHRGQTWMTFTYDTGLLRASDAAQLARIYRRQIDEFLCAAC